MKYYLIAGEASGDLHASNLMKAIKAQDSTANFRYWGGDLMHNQGGQLVKHYRELSFMGFAEVIMNLPTIIRNLSFCKRDILAFAPDALIFIDYPGFNLRIAQWAKNQGLSTHFYISPQIWAWKESRIQQIKRNIDYMYVILPFEKSFYEDRHGYPVDFVGHPLLDALHNRSPMDPQKFRKENKLDQRPVIALLPGSRKQEIRKMLSVMIKMCHNFKDYQFVIAGAPSQEPNVYQSYLGPENLRLVINKTYDLLSISKAAMVTSGTATLETALLKVPEVVCYKGSHLSYLIAKKLVKLKFISLVNLIMDREVVRELIQDTFNPKELKQELSMLLNSEKRSRIFEDYYELEQKLGGPGASAKTAELIYQRTV